MNSEVHIASWGEIEDRQKERVRALIQEFRARFSRSPHFVVLAPGRVNLIGEHTDYNGYPVLPAALDRHVAVAIARRVDEVVTAHTTAPGLPQCSFSLSAPLHPAAGGHWGNYVKAAVQLLLARVPDPRGADLLVDGTVPTGAGLSSSSALVVGAGLAFLACAGLLPLPRLSLAEEFARAEQFVGTLSGGMDQACCLLATDNTVMRIDFFPLRVRPVAFPTGYEIAVCHSLVTADKSGNARTAYNLRVWECKVAARVLALLSGQRGLEWVDRLADLERAFPSPSRQQLLHLLEENIPDKPLSIEHIARLLRISVDLLLPEASSALAPQQTPLKLLRRVRHVFSEAERVELAERALAKADIDALGRAMRASHASCRDDYEVSCDALEALVETASSAGAIGARLTGAGFGGCTVQLVRQEHLPEFFERIDRDFYTKRLPAGSNFREYRFAFRPHYGARVIAID